MQKEVLAKETVDAVLQGAEALDRASLFEGSTQAPFRFQKITINMNPSKTEEDPYIVNIPFKSVYVEFCEQPSATIFLKPNTRDSFQSSIQLRLGTTLSFNKPITKCYLWWNKIAGIETDPPQKVTLVFCTDGQIENSNSLIQLANFGQIANYALTLPATTATIVAGNWFDSQNAGGNPRKIMIYNDTGGVIYLGADTTVTNANGFPIPDGGYFEHINLAALYAYSVAGGDVRVLYQT